MQLAMTKDSGESAASIEVADTTFAVKYNEALVHQVVTSYLASGRSGSSAQKKRSEVRGGGRKPWRQKGTGHARAGSIRSPIWRGGGTTFAAKPRDWSQKVNRKMYRGAMRSILSELLRNDRLVVVEDLAIDPPKTKDLAGRLRAMGLDDVLIVVEEHDRTLELAARNLPWAEVVDSDRVSPIGLLAFEKVLATASGLKALEERLG